MTQATEQRNSRSTEKSQATEEKLDTAGELFLHTSNEVKSRRYPCSVKEFGSIEKSGMTL